MAKLKIKTEGIVRGGRETRLSFQRRCLALYDVKAGRTSYEATRKSPDEIAQ